MTQEEHHFIEQLYIENFEILYHYAYAVLRDRLASENLVNDTFLDAIKKAARILNHENPTGWLLNALKLNIKHYMSSQAKQPTVVPLDTVNEHAFEQISTVRDTDPLFLRNALSEEERRFFELYYKKDYSHKELAEEFGISVSASQKRLERIRKQLQKAL